MGEQLPVLNKPAPVDSEEEDQPMSKKKGSAFSAFAALDDG